MVNKGFTAESRKLPIGIFKALAFTVPLQATCDLLFDRKERKITLKANTYKNLKNKILPGDIIFSGKKSRHYKSLLPGIKKNEILTLISRNPQYHSALYLGKGKILHSIRNKTRIENMKKWVPRESLIVYRPQIPDKDKEKAINYAKKKLIGIPYKKPLNTFITGLKILYDPFRVPKASRSFSKKEGLICTQIPIKTYPKIFKKEYLNPYEMRKIKKLKPIIRYDRTEPTSIKEKIIHRILGPTLKTLPIAIPLSFLKI